MVVNLYVMLGAICDWRFYRIPNVLCLCMAITGFFFSYLELGVGGIWSAVIGMAEPIVILYVLFYCKVLGAGDIKLLSAIGTFLGGQIWRVMILSFLFNGIGALIKMYKSESLMTRYCYLRGYLRDCQMAGKLLRDYEGSKENQIHFSIGIFCASLSAFLSAYATGKVSFLTGILS